MTSEPFSRIFTHQGYWWVEGSDHHYVGGELHFDPSNGGSLKCWGHILEGRTVETIPIVRGVTSDRKQVTLVNCIGGGVTYQAGTFAVEQLLPETILIGNFYPDPNLLFKSCSFRFSDIDGWVPSRYVDVNPKRGGLDVKVRSKRFGEIACRARNYKVSLESRYKWSSSYRDIDVDTYTFANLRPKKAQIADWFVTEIWNFRDLASLCFGLPLTLQQISLYRNEIRVSGRIKEREYVDVYYADARIASSSGSIDAIPIVSYLQLVGKNEDILSQWIEQKELFAETIDLISAVLYATALHSEVKFLLMMQAFEAFDRVANPRKLVDEDKYKKIYDAMMAVIPFEELEIEGQLKNDLRQKLDSSIKYANEPSLRKRLKDFHASLSKSLGDAPLVFSKSQIGQIVDTRNYYTHYAEELRDKILSKEETNAIAERFCALLIISILEKLGFESSQTGGRFSLHRRFRRFTRAIKSDTSAPES